MNLYKKPKVENNNTLQSVDTLLAPADSAELSRAAARAQEIWTKANEGKEFKDYDASSDGVFVTLTQKQGRTPASWYEIKVYQDYDGTWTVATNSIRPGLETEPHGTLLRESALYPISVERPVVTGKLECCRAYDDGSLEVVLIKNAGEEQGILNQTQCQSLAESLDGVVAGL